MRTPDGVEWRVSRRWFPRVRVRLRRTPIDGGAALESIGVGDDLQSLFLWVAAVVVVIFVVVPLLLFGFELVIAGCVIAGSVLARVVLGKPWVIEATTVSGSATPRRLEWEVRGWRRSSTAMQQVAADLAAGREPFPQP